MRSRAAAAALSQHAYQADTTPDQPTNRPTDQHSSAAGQPASTHAFVGGSAVLDARRPPPVVTRN